MSRIWHVAGQGPVGGEDQLLTAAGRALIDDVSADAQLTTLGVTAAGKALLDDANAAAQLVTLGALPKAGGTMTGNIVMGNGTILSSGPHSPGNNIPISYFRGYATSTNWPISMSAIYDADAVDQYLAFSGYLDGGSRVSPTFFGAGYGGAFIRYSTTVGASSGMSLGYFPAGAGSPPTVAIRIKDNGNVGIGLINPLAKLDILGSFNFKTTTDLGGYHFPFTLKDHNGAIGFAISDEGHAWIMGKYYLVFSNPNLQISGFHIATRNTPTFPTGAAVCEQATIAGWEWTQDDANTPAAQMTVADMPNYLTVPQFNWHGEINVKPSLDHDYAQSGHAQLSVIIGAGQTDPALTTNGRIVAAQFQLSALNTAPANAGDTGTTGEIRWASGYVYLCVATDTWQRAALATWA